MLSARYAPVAVQAEITGKGQPDLQEFNHRKATAGDTYTAQKSYPLGDGDVNLSIMPGELLVARRTYKTGIAGQGEAVFSSVAGMYCETSVEALMRQHYFAGVAKSEYQLGGDNLFGTDPMDHGIGFLRAGSMSTLNACAEDVHAGDLLAWRFPESANLPDPRSRGADRAIGGPDNGLNPRKIRRMQGIPLGKPLIQIEKFNPADFSFQLAGAHALFNKPAAQGGIQDLGTKDLMDPHKKISPLQEEALGWSRGLLAIVATAMEHLEKDKGVAFAKATGLMETELTSTGQEILNAIFLRNTVPGTNNGAINQVNIKTPFGQIQDHCLSILCGAIGGAWHAKASRIIGKSMGNAKAGQTLDVMFSHFKIGF